MFGRRSPLLARVGWIWLVAALGTPAGAQPLDGQASALANIGSVRVDVQLVGATVQAGLDRVAIREDVEARLRDFSVGVRGPDDHSERGDPALRVTAQVTEAAGGYVFLVSVQLVERVINYRRYVTLVFDGALPTSPTDSVTPLEIAPGIKWEAQALGTTRGPNAPTSIPRAILDYVDRFIEDYLAANR